MTITFTAIASAELTSRLSAYQTILQSTSDAAAREEKREQLNHRYICLQTAIWIDANGKGPKPAIIKSPEEVRSELIRWMKDIQKDSTVQTMHRDGRDIAIIQAFLAATAPVVAQPVQTSIV